MPRPKKPNGESSIYEGADGWWHGRVTVGLKPDGSLDRRHVRGHDEDEVTEKVRRLEAKRDAAKVPAPGHTPTVAEWMRTWLDTIAPRTAQQTTVDEIYRPKVERWIIPGSAGTGSTGSSRIRSTSSTRRSREPGSRRRASCSFTRSCPAR